MPTVRREQYIGAGSTHAFQQPLGYLEGLLFQSRPHQAVFGENGEFFPVHDERSLPGPANHINLQVQVPCAIRVKFHGSVHVAVLPLEQARLRVVSVFNRPLSFPHLYQAVIPRFDWEVQPVVMPVLGERALDEDPASL